MFHLLRKIKPVHWAIRCECWRLWTRHSIFVANRRKRTCCICESIAQRRFLCTASHLSQATHLKSFLPFCHMWLSLAGCRLVLRS